MVHIPNVMEDLMKPYEQGGLGNSSVQNLYSFQGVSIRFFDWLEASDNLERLHKPQINLDLFVQSFTIILGMQGQGKSYTGSVLLEQLISSHVPVFIVDFTGEVKTIVDYFGEKKIKVVTEIQSGETEYGTGKKKKMIPTTFGARDAEEFLNGWDSMYFDVSEYVDRPGLAKHYLLDFLTKAIEIKKRIFREQPELKRPHYCYFDEAHNFAPEDLPAEERNDDPPIGLMLNQKMATIAKEMRKYGLPCCWLSQRARSCNKNVLAECNVEILLPVNIDLDVKRYRALLPTLPNLTTMMNEMAKHKGRGFLKVIGKGDMFPAPVYRMQIAPIRKSRDAARTPGMAENLGFKYGSGTQINVKPEDTTD